jgi:hypothetical protein
MHVHGRPVSKPAECCFEAASYPEKGRPPQGDCVDVGDTMPVVWPVVLHSWCQPFAGRGYTRRDGSQVETATERVERVLSLPAGMVEPCLHVQQGRPVSYGVHLVERFSGSS